MSVDKSNFSYRAGGTKEPPAYYLCDVPGDLPAGAVEGDLGYVKSTDRVYYFTNAWITVASGAGNYAQIDASNIFTASPQTIAPATGVAVLQLIGQTSIPIVVFVDNTQPANARRFQIQDQNQLLMFWSTDDAGGGQTQILTMDRVGNAVHAGDVWVKNRIFAGLATNAGIAQGDIMAGRSATSGVMYLGSDGGTYIYRQSSTSVVINTQLPLVSNYHYFPGRVDTVGTAQQSWYIGSHASYGLYSNSGFYIAGNLWTGGVVEASNYVRSGVGLYDYGRGTPVGVWIDAGVPPAGNWTIATHYANNYAMIGNTMLWLCVEVGTVAGNPAGLLIYWPLGFGNPTYQSGAIGQCLVGGTRVNASWFASPGVTYISVVRNDGAVWPSGASVNMQFQAFLRTA